MGNTMLLEKLAAALQLASITAEQITFTFLHLLLQTSRYFR